MSTIQTQSREAVVVGVDHKSFTDRAVDEGVRQARISRRPLHLVCVRPASDWSPGARTTSQSKASS